MTDSAYEAQLRQQLYEARQEVTALKADRARLEDEVGPLRQRLAEALDRAEKAEALAAAARQEAEMWEQARDAECLTTAVVFHEYYRRWQSTVVEARRQCARAEKAEVAS